MVTGDAVTVPGYDDYNEWPKVASATVACPTGKVVLGGGASLTGDSIARLTGSYPSDGGHSWTVSAQNYMYDVVMLTPYAICATAGS
jgi:hypothetical protein